MTRWLSAVVLMGGLASLAFGCGGDDGGEVVGGGAATSTGGKGGTSGAGGSGGSSAGCTDDVDCGAGKFCSVSNTCAPTGTCVADGDCESGNFCSSTKACIPTGTCAAAGDCGAGLTCDAATQKCVPGGGCGAEEFAIEAVAPNMFISLDRSCSMTGAGGGGKTKWVIAVDALNQMMTTFNGKIRWGIGLFPDITGDKCTQDAPAFAVADGNESKIQALLTAALQKADKYFPDGPCVTNIDTAMQQASQEPAFQDTTRKSYALLITDGAQAGCSAAGGDAGTEKIITQMNAAGVSTFVLGFGTGIDAAQMNKFAIAGGVPNNDPTAPTVKYYKADDTQSLQAALGKIAGSIIGCTFTLSTTPKDPSKIFVFFDNVKVPQDKTHQAGWDYDAATNQLTFYGVDCDKLKSQSVTDVDVVFGCDQPTPG
ncbi:MAG: VWA domain-containing protein [Myxococcales bacterium]|nr:VWA domain-containing protein [Myxococcales bacterium]